MEVQFAVAKMPKFGLGVSGDTVEIVERPRGGITAIMADGQSHGRPAKRVSHLVVAKAAQLIADGIRDGAVARGVHDHLYAARDGKVSTELVMVSADFRTKSLVITRNTHTPVFLRLEDGRVEQLDQYVEPIGVHELMKPLITEVPLRAGQVVLAFTDGVLSAGSRHGTSLDTASVNALVTAADPAGSRSLADSILEQALVLDKRRPSDDMTVLAMGVSPTGDDEQPRRLSISVPF